MALAIYFANKKFSPDAYDETIQKLDAAGASSPKGRSYHAAFEMDGDIHVFDVWESQEDFDAFGQTLMPILTELGVEVAQPSMANVHNTITG